MSPPGFQILTETTRSPSLVPSIISSMARIGPIDSVSDSVSSWDNGAMKESMNSAVAAAVLRTTSVFIRLVTQ
ncbi:MAG: hypothetical protein IPL47_04605 [Phyllobacteriaceae bacterium]|nr:hypothetical protein [Phyllobacteriaceae bacterium]